MTAKARGASPAYGAEHDGYAWPYAFSSSLVLIRALDCFPDTRTWLMYLRWRVSSRWARRARPTPTRTWPKYDTLACFQRLRTRTSNVGYCCPQAALNMMTHTCARDFISSHILVNCVDTGWVTDMVRLGSCTFGRFSSTNDAGTLFVGPPWHGGKGKDPQDPRRAAARRGGA